MSLGTGQAPYPFPVVTIGSRISQILEILNLAIRDNTAHYSSIVSIPAGYSKATFVVNHTLDQDGTYQLYGSKDNTQTGGAGTLMDNAYAVGSAVTIKKSTGWSFVESVPAIDFHPYMQMTVTETAPPSTGLSDLWAMLVA